MTDVLLARYVAAAQAAELTDPPMGESTRRRMVDFTIRETKTRKAS